MRNFKCNAKIISILTSSMLVLTCSGCSISKNDDNINYNNLHGESIDASIDYTLEDIHTNMTSTASDIVETTISTTVTTYESVVENVPSTIIETYTEVVDDITPEENMILEHFKNLGEDIKNSIDSEKLLEKGKTYFIYCVDFLFFNEPINGVTFSSLRDSVKSQILENIVDIDAVICTKYPNYKESISDKYTYVYDNAMELIKKGSANIKDFSKEKLGEDNINKLEEYKELFKDQISDNYDDLSDLAEKGKEKVKSWYEEFKRN